MRTKEEKWSISLSSIATCISCILFFVLAVPGAAFAQESVTRIHILPFDYQDAIIIESDGRFGMVDSGESEDYPDGSDPRYPFRPGTIVGQGTEEKVISYMKSIGVTSDNFDFYIGTHPHSDHIGSAPQIISEFKPKRVYTPRYADSYITNTDALWDNQYVYDRLIKSAADNGALLIQDFDKNASVTPDSGTYTANPVFTLGQAMIEICNTDNSDCANGLPDANCLSYGVKVIANGKTAFLAGDINNLDGDEDRLALSLGHIDFLKLGHHGNVYSNTSGYLRALSPSLAFMTGNISFTPVSTLDELANIGTSLFQSSDCRNEGLDSFVVELTFSGVNYNLDIPIPQLYYNSWCKSYVAYQNGLRKKLNGWQKTEDGFTWFDNGFVSVRDKWIIDGGSTYYIDKQSQMSTGWACCESDWYWFGDTGAMATGWVKVDGSWYYLGPSGAMATGWVKVDGSWYYLGPSGAMAFNCWLGNYYLCDTGAMAVNRLVESWWVGEDGLRAFNMQDSGLN